MKISTDSVLKAVSALLTALGGAVVAIPGMSALGSEAWWPPGGASQLFRVVATILGAGVLLMMLLARARIASARRGNLACGAGLVLALGLTIGYFVALDQAVLDFVYYRVDRSVVVPFDVGSWASPELLELTRNLDPPPGLEPADTPAELDKAHLKPVYEKWGIDGVKPFIPPDEMRETIAKLLFLYCSCVTLLVATITAAGIRAGVGTRMPTTRQSPEPTRPPDPGQMR